MRPERVRPRSPERPTVILQRCIIVLATRHAKQTGKQGDVPVAFSKAGAGTNVVNNGLGFFADHESVATGGGMCRRCLQRPP